MAAAARATNRPRRAQPPRGGSVHRALRYATSAHLSAASRWPSRGVVPSVASMLGQPWRNRPATIARVARPARDMRSPIARPARDGAARDVSRVRHGGRRRARRRPDPGKTLALIPLLWIRIRPPARQRKNNIKGRETINTINSKQTTTFIGCLSGLPCWHLCLAPTGITIIRLFSVDCGSLRQSGPRPDPRLLRQAALEALTRSARTDSPRRTGRKQFSGDDRRRRRRRLGRRGGAAFARV
ncbi:hypothetical protein F511_15795 [Dorcoceras hygrometricum]|uniref:Uncharacterized protein n=1 Tax=Dorcoceras hygrometricum TaxID=472368 RepID=A0A2Z7BLA5_9LAMI|nr:hypothetical protein F511_15795 [Dorcoceras hygrometricum]